MKSIKRGRGPSMMGGIVSLCAAGFGVLWVVGASSVSNEMSMMGPGFGMMNSGFGITDIFPLFGVIFIIIAVASAIYNFKNATSKHRYSEFDITDSGEEPDPLNQRFGEEKPAPESSIQDHERRFCPYCGSRTDKDHRFCGSCGKKLDE